MCARDDDELADLTIGRLALYCAEENPDATDGTAGACDAHGRAHRLAVADALEHGMSAEPAGQLAYPLDRGVPPLTDDIGRPEPAGQGDAVRVAATLPGRTFALSAA